MSCVLRIDGENLDLKELIELFPDPIAIFRKGEERLGGRPGKTNCANYNVSDADFDSFTEQKKDAISFLRRNGDSLQEAMAVSGVESAELDFGVEQRGVYVQNGYLEP